MDWQNLPQPLDVVVVNGPFRLLRHPLLSFARSFEDLLAKILPAYETILTGEDQLGVPLPQGQFGARQLGAHARDGGRLPGSGLAGELFRLLAQ
jgi:hypothetical protein